MYVMCEVAMNDTTAVYSPVPKGNVPVMSGEQSSLSRPKLLRKNTGT